MKILVIGGGAREHAIAWTLAAEDGVSDVLCAPGNAGIASVARCVPADAGRPADLLAIAARERVDLTVVGPELPLSAGIVDLFVAERRPIVGPTQSAAALESSKAFAKDFMRRHGIPTAGFEVCHSAEAARAAVADGRLGYPLVLKADGLAAGKGVVIAEDRAAADAAVDAAMTDRRFGDAGDRLVLEEYLAGEEASYFVLADGTSFVSLSSAQDHKRIFDDDRGPNTGGMGAFAPSVLLTPEVERTVLDEIVRPVLQGMAREGRPFRGFLYVGLMLTAGGPKVIEFNVRLGDPETQVLLPRLAEPLSVLLASAAAGALPDRVRLRPEPHVGIVLAAKGYPDAPETGQIITGLEEAASIPGALLFHAATTRRDGHLVTSGGRVITVVGGGATYEEAIGTAYRAASHVRFDGMQFRRDIGRESPQRAAGMKYSVVTFGCRVNQADSLEVEDGLRARGGVAAPPEAADVVVVNTCSVTSSADQAARQTIRRIAHANPAVRIVVTGCYATREPSAVSGLPNVVRIVPNTAKETLADAIAGDIGPDTAQRFGGGAGACGSTLEPGVAGRTALTLRVQTGCEEQCSYCIIPSTRGVGRSRALDRVLRDVRFALEAGYREIVVTGVHLGSYGRDLRDGSSLAGLLTALAAESLDALFRISSLEPMDCTPEVVEIIAASPRLAPHFHLPLQHGSDEMLRAMRRPYTVAYYERLIERIHTRLPDASIGSDIIVGFPGETETHVGEMRTLLQRLPLSHLHVFPYSDRPGTPASRLPDKVHGLEIRNRGREIRAIGEGMASRFRRSQIGRTLRALTVDDGSSVVTENFLKLRLDVGLSRNEWVQVRVAAEYHAHACV